MRWTAVILLAATLGGLCRGTARAQPGSPTLEDLVQGRVPVVDLSYVLNEKTVFWPGERYHPFRIQTIATLERDGVLSKAVSFPEHIGTHMDAPNHFWGTGASVDQLPPRAFFAPGVMIDVAAVAAADPDFRLQRHHVQAWEERFGPVPQGAVVLLNTGWHRHWGNAVRYQNMDVQGRMHFPGYGVSAAEYLVQKRKVRGLGIDTMSIDYGLSRDFPVHKIAARAGVYGLENVANLDRLPPRGFYVFVAPMKVEGGTGGPTRIFAILARPQEQDGGGKP